jgi:hypothetical protein
MNTWKRAIRSVVIGFAISIVALGFGWLGGWGSPGSASALATIGGVLGYWQTTALCAVAPSMGEFLATGLEHHWQRMAATFALLVFVPACTWSTLVFTVWSLRMSWGAHWWPGWSSRG